jgi:flagella basal body P-ring formation protein FlgA
MNKSLIQLLLILAALAPAATAPAGQDTPDTPAVLNILSDIRIRASQITLGDLVANRAELPADWARRVVCPGPARPGAAQTYTLVSLATALQQYPDMQSVNLRGLPQVRILRQARRPDAQQLATAMEQYMADASPWREGKYSATTEADTLLPGMPDGTSDIRIIHLQGSGAAGRLTATACYTDGTNTQGTPFTFPVQVTREQVVWTAAADLPRGHILEADDVIPVALTTDGRTAYAPAETPVVGLELLRDTKTGQGIAQAAIRQPVCSEKGALVTIAARTGGLVVSVRAKAMSRGRRGDIIMCYNESSKRQFHARLTGPNQGELAEL